ncbi:hypothetical protein K2X85_00540 [bacterium]|nr:hypothetical protein [bacterium]
MKTFPQKNPFQVESLEERVVLSSDLAAVVAPSNVSALVSNGILQIRGDNLGNNVDITQLSNGQFQIKGNTGTLINQRSSPVVLGNVVDINAQLRDGNDSLTLSLQNNRSLRDISIDMGAGQREKVVVKGGKEISGNLIVTTKGTSALNFDTDGTSLDVKGRTTIVGNSAVGSTTGDKINLLGKYNILYVETGDGNDSVTLGIKCNCATNVRFNSNKATVKTRAGNDSLQLFKVKADDFFADLGAGNDSLSLATVQLSNTSAKARLQGGSGTDAIKELTSITGQPLYISLEGRP